MGAGADGLVLDELLETPVGAGVVGDGDEEELDLESSKKCKVKLCRQTRKRKKTYETTTGQAGRERTAG